jgi:hypothetical protein
MPVSKVNGLADCYKKLQQSLSNMESDLAARILSPRESLKPLDLYSQKPHESNHIEDYRSALSA